MQRPVIIGLINAVLKKKTGQSFLGDGNMVILVALQYPNPVRKFVGGRWHGSVLLSFLSLSRTSRKQNRSQTKRPQGARCGVIGISCLQHGRMDDADDK